MNWYPTASLHGVTTQKNSNFHRRESLKSRSAYYEMLHSASFSDGLLGPLSQTFCIDILSERNKGNKDEEKRQKPLCNVVPETWTRNPPWVSMYVTFEGTGAAFRMTSSELTWQELTRRNYKARIQTWFNEHVLTTNLSLPCTCCGTGVTQLWNNLLIAQAREAYAYSCYLAHNNNVRYSCSYA